MKRPDSRTSLSSYLRQNALALVALFFALTSGTAVALEGSDTVFSDDIVNGEVRTPDLADAGVTTGKVDLGAINSARVKDDSLRSEDILDGEIHSIDVAFGTLRGDEIQDETIGGNDIVNGGISGDDVDESTLFNDNSLTTADLATDSVGQGELGPNSVGAGELNLVQLRGGTPVSVPGGAEGNGDVKLGQSTATCPGSEQLIAGDAIWTDNDLTADQELYVVEISPVTVTNTVTAIGANDTDHDHMFQAIALCLSA